MGVKWVWHGCDLYVLPRQLPGQNRNGHLSWMGGLPGHLDGHLDMEGYQTSRNVPAFARAFALHRENISIGVKY